MLAKFNSTGTHIKNGYLKVRIDLYPEPENKTYALYHVDEVDDEGKPTGVKRLNPCLCHFIKIDTSTTLSGLTDYMKGILDKDTILELDGLLSKANIDRQKLSQIMKAKCGAGDRVAFVPIDLNSRLSSLEIKVGY